MSEITTMTTTEHRRQYADDGVTLVRAAFDPAWIDRLRAASDRAMSQRGWTTSPPRVSAGRAVAIPAVRR